MMKLRILIALSILACALPASAKKYYLVMGNSFAESTPKPALTRYIYDTDNPTQVTPAPGKGLDGALFATCTENVISGLMYFHGKILATCSKTGKVLKFDAYTGKNECVLATGLNKPAGIAIGPDNDLYIACKDYVVRYSLTGKPKPGMDNFGDTFVQSGIKYGDGIAFDKTGNLIVCNQGLWAISCFSRETGDILATYANGKGVYSDIKEGADGLLYITATGATGLDNKGFLGILDRKAHRFEQKALDGLVDPYGLTFTPDNKMLVTSYSGGRARLYDNGKLLGLIGTPISAEKDYRAVFYSIVTEMK